MIETAHAFIDKAASQLGLDSEQTERVKKINKEHKFTISLNNGQTFQAYRIQHNNKRGPYKGGIRFHPNVSLDEVRTLATLMSLKTAAVGLPLGGAKGGVVVDPKQLSGQELEELSRQYVRYLYKYIGPKLDIPAPDVNTNAQIIDWMEDEYSKLSGDKSEASFTGKSLGNSGSEGRDAATGLGGVIATSELLKLERSKEDISYAVQGFGNVGSFFASNASRLNPKWRLIAASDSEAAVYDPKGLNVKHVFDFKDNGGRFKNYKEAKTISNAELLALKVDVLVLAGLEDSLTEANMRSVKAKYIIEMGNGPINEKAYNYLTKAGKVILPDIVANAGGVIVSYLEWKQNLKKEHWSEASVNSKLKVYMTRATKDIFAYAKEHKTDLKNAAFIKAVKLLSD